MEETISLKDIFLALRKRWKLIFSLVFLSITISAVVSYFYLTPVYQASTQILVNQSNQNENGVNYSDVQQNLQLINTYNVIIKSPAILQLVIEELNLTYSVEKLSKKISVTNEQDSQVVNIIVQDEDISNAVAVANTTSIIFQKEIVNIMNIDNISILSKAIVQDNHIPIKPNPIINIAIAIAVSLMVGAGLSFLMEYLDNTLKEAQDVEKELNVPVLGVITVIDEKDKESRKLKSEVNIYKRGETLGS